LSSKRRAAAKSRNAVAGGFVGGLLGSIINLGVAVVGAIVGGKKGYDKNPNNDGRSVGYVTSVIAFHLKRISRMNAGIISWLHSIGSIRCLKLPTCLKPQSLPLRQTYDSSSKP
jgi:hypothetical protein